MSFCSQNSDSVSKPDASRGDDCSSWCPYTFGALTANNRQRRSVQNPAQPGSASRSYCNSLNSYMRLLKVDEIHTSKQQAASMRREACASALRMLATNNADNQATLDPS